jgi:hydroxymethylpyrimidine pyrophosphatase-like HAD family hydrolase
MTDSESMIIAVDFDGTVVDHRFPEVGPDVPGAVSALKELVADGHKIILWTMRSDVYLAHAVEWYAAHEIPLYGVNVNPGQKIWTSSPKAYAHAYVDDAAVGCPLITLAAFNRPCVDWPEVMRRLFPSTALKTRNAEGTPQ